MKVDVNQALNVARGIVKEQENKVLDQNETVEQTKTAVNALVKEGHKEDVIFSTLSRLNVDMTLITTDMVREMIAEARQTEILSPGDSAPIGEGNPNPWEEFNQQEDAKAQQENTETPVTDDSQ